MNGSPSSTGWRRFWRSFIAVLAVGSLLVAPAVFFTIAFVVLVFGVAPTGIYWRRRFKRLRSHRLNHSGRELVHIDPGGSVRGTIDLTKPYRVTYAFKGHYWAVYRVYQGSQQVEFTSEHPDAEHLVKDVLDFGEFPPVMKMSI